MPAPRFSQKQEPPARPSTIVDRLAGRAPVRWRRIPELRQSRFAPRLPRAAPQFLDLPADKQASQPLWGTQNVQERGPNPTTIISWEWKLFIVFRPVANAFSWGRPTWCVNEPVDGSSSVPGEPVTRARAKIGVLRRIGATRESPSSANSYFFWETG